MGDWSHRIIGLFVLVFLLILPMAFGATEDFQYTAPSSVDVCACTNFALEGTLINNGDVTSHYFISDVGTASAWTQAVPEYFTLDSELHQRDIMTFVNVPCNAEGPYTLYTKIKTSLGLEKIHAALLNVMKCDIIDINPVKVKNEVCAGDVAVYEFQAENKGPFEEKIKPSVDDFHDYIDFNLPLYTLQSNELEPIYLYVASFDQIGTYSFNVTLTATRSGYAYTIPVEYTAVDCAPDVEADEDDEFELDLGFLLIPLDILLYIIIALLILLLLLLIALLIVKAIKKKKNRQTLDDWIEPKEEPAPPKKEKKVVAKAKKKPEKKAKKKPKKKMKPADKQKLKSILFWIILAILLLLLLGLLAWGFIAAWPYMTDWTTSWINQTFNGTDNMTGLANGTGVPVENITTQPIAPVVPNETIANETINATGNLTDINATNPIIEFFTNYGSSCAFMISVFLVLFILSLLLLGIRSSEEWSDKKKFAVKYIKYAIPIILFICLAFTFVFCIFNNLQEDEWPGRCSVVILENTTDTNVTLNATQLQNNPYVVVEKQGVASCFCHTLFGTSMSIWMCILILILLILLILFIIWLILMIPLWWAAFKARPKKEKKKTVEVKKKTEKKKEKESSNIWKDILLLLILLLLLLLLGFFFRSCELYTSGNETANDSMHNVTDMNETDSGLGDGADNGANESDDNKTGLVVVTPPSQEQNITEDVIETPVDQNLLCDVKFFDPGDEGISLLPDELKDIDESDLVYTWYLDRDGDGNYVAAQSNVKSNKIPADDIKEGDMWKCQVSFTTSDDKTYSVMSDPYLVVPVEGDEPVQTLQPPQEPEDGDIDNATAADNVTAEEVDPELEKVNEMLQYVEDNNLTDTFSYFVIESGDTEDVNLSKYFVDPDGDELFFDVEEVTSENVSVDIWKGSATIKAEKGFIGIVNATFTAEDPSGETVFGDMTIIVKPSEGFKFGEWWDKYGNYVIVGVIIIILLIIVIILYNRIMEDDGKKGKKQKKEDNQGFFKNF